VISRSPVFSTGPNFSKSPFLSTVVNSSQRSFSSHLSSILTKCPVLSSVLSALQRSYFTSCPKFFPSVLSSELFSVPAMFPVPSTVLNASQASCLLSFPQFSPDVDGHACLYVYSRVFSMAQTLTLHPLLPAQVPGQHVFSPAITAVLHLVV
jgi:hypothetical protein